MVDDTARAKSQPYFAFHSLPPHHSHFDSLSSESAFTRIKRRVMTLQQRRVRLAHDVSRAGHRTCRHIHGVVAVAIRECRHTPLLDQRTRGAVRRTELTFERSPRRVSDVGAVVRGSVRVKRGDRDQPPLGVKPNDTSVIAFSQAGRPIATAGSSPHLTSVPWRSSVHAAPTRSIHLRTSRERALVEQVNPAAGRDGAGLQHLVHALPRQGEPPRRRLRWPFPSGSPRGLPISSRAGDQRGYA